MLSLRVLRPSKRHLIAAMSSNVNATGLTPSESKQLKERSAQSHEQPIIAALKEMYSCSPKDSTFGIYTKDAVFHDPVGIAKGSSSISAQFIGLAKLFPRAEVTKFRVLENPSSLPPPKMLIDQDVAYYRNASNSSPTKVVNSLLTLDLDSNHKVTFHTEEWDHEKSSTSDDGFFGMLNEYRKKLTASMTDTVVGDQKK
ncbi:hypothetical protein CPB85DRAFT_1265180 [Mucidula mucida]|nr:hypothetical protein CPB85DRAFT_1265180 [Mucidula mucida]